MMSISLPNQGPKPVAWSKKAMVSSSHPAVTKVMLDVLRDGGNAIDAAVAGSLVQPFHGGRVYQGESEELLEGAV